MIAHQEPHLFLPFIMKQLGEDAYNALMVRAYKSAKVDLGMVYLALINGEER